MALVQTPKMTEKNLAGHRRNARQSRGAATSQGKERARAANLRHGYYSKVNDHALTALGEDPQALAALIAGAHEQWRPANPHQAWITERLARLQWKIDRSDRIQENAMARAVQRVADRRAERALETHYCYTDVHDALSMISSDTLRPDYYTPPGYLSNFARALKVNRGPRMDEILRLLHRLREPEGYQPFTGRLRAGASTHREWKEVREIFEDDSAIPHPEIPIAQGEERDDLRAELHDLAAAELEEVKLVWEEKLLPKADEPLTQIDRDDLAASTYKMTELIRRQEHSCFREFFRLGTFLVKLQDEEPLEECATVAKTTDEMPQPDSSGEAPAAADPDHAGQVTSPTTTHKNEGASGDVDENTGEGESRGADLQPYPPPEVTDLPEEPGTATVQQASR
jgi:hypothetical protein